MNESSEGAEYDRAGPSDSDFATPDEVLARFLDDWAAPSQQFSADFRLARDQFLRDMMKAFDREWPLYAELVGSEPNRLTREQIVRFYLLAAREGGFNRDEFIQALRVSWLQKEQPQAAP